MKDCRHSLPSPEEFFGFVPGSDRCMIRWDSLCAYYRLLEANSDRLRVTVPGKTSEGNEFLILYISAKENLEKLETYREISRRLADARGMTNGEIAALSEKGKAVCMLGYGLHSNEVGGPQCFPLVLYDLLSAAPGTELYEALQNVVVIASPCSEPDGEIVFTDWYEKYKGTKYEGMCSPYLRHNWAGHSNNRDAMREAVIESTYLNDVLLRDFCPQVFLDFHHDYPYKERMNIAPFADPLYARLCPLTERLSSLYGAEMALALSLAGRRGVVSGGEAFNNFPLTSFYSNAALHNVVGMLAENADCNIATPVYVHPETIVGTRTPTMHCPDPWKGGEWHLSDIVAQMRIASLALIKTVSKNKNEVLACRAKASLLQTERGKADPRVAFLIPQAQDDPSTLSLLLSLVERQTVDIFQTTETMTLDGKTYPAGTYAVPLAQPNYAAVCALLSNEPFPVENAKIRADGSRIITDTANLSLAYSMGIYPACANEPLPDGALQKAKIEPYRVGPLPLSCRENASYREVNRLLASGVRVGRDAGGDFVPFEANAGISEIRRAKVGLLKKSVTYNEEEGYTRNLLRRYGFDYEIVLDKNVRENGVPAHLDVLIIPGDLPETLLCGDTAPDAPPEYHSGLGTDGGKALVAFVERGGRLIGWEKTCLYLDLLFGLRLRESTRGLPKTAFSTDGSVLAAACEKDVLTRGMPQRFTLSHWNDPVLLPTDVAGRMIDVVARLATDGLLVSGCLTGEEYLRATPCLMRAKFGKGEVLLYTFNPEFRIQQDATFKLLFNALYQTV